MRLAVGRGTLVVLTVGVVFAVFGLGAAINPRLAAGATLAVAAAVFAVRARRLGWDLYLVVLGGSLVLGYGFANVGITGGLPVPVADAAAVFLALYVVAAGGRLWPPSAPFRFALAFFAVGLARLTVDLPHYGKEALRDFTLPLELVFLGFGYWAMSRYATARWVAALKWVFCVCLFYFLLFPWRDHLAALGPTVGLQRSVPLLGSYAGAGTAAAAGLFFFALLRPFGRLSYAVAAGFLLTLALFQLRGLYLAVPVAIAIVWVLARPDPATGARSGLVGTLAAGAVALALLLPLAPAGRLGPVSPDFAAAQLKTLRGDVGPGSGSYKDRVKWFHSVMERVRETPYGWAVGIGLGPDLISTSGDASQIRKPHDDYLEIFGRLGLAGLAAFVAFLGTACFGIVRAARRTAGVDARFLWWIVATAIVFILVAATQPLLAFPYGTIPLFSLLGAGLALANRTRSQSAAHVEFE